LGKDPQPGHMKDFVTTTQDNGGVHLNSGIPNHAFYLSAIDIGGFAWEKAGRIWYKTLTEKLSDRSNFQDAANLTYQAAGELYGTGSREQLAVKNGWLQVGINIDVVVVPPPPSPIPPTPLPVPPTPVPGNGCMTQVMHSIGWSGYGQPKSKK
jgi:hypothetical protein